MSNKFGKIVLRTLKKLSWTDFFYQNNGWTQRLVSNEQAAKIHIKRSEQGRRGSLEVVWEKLALVDEGILMVDLKLF